MTATIRQILLSEHTDERGLPVGYGTDLLDENGEFEHYNDIIDANFERVFRGMRLNKYVTEEFKKQFCLRFYNRKVQAETFSQFQQQLETFLNTDAFNLLKYMDAVRDMEPDELAVTVDLLNKGDANQNGLGILSNEPQKDLSIIYPNNSGVIRYASSLQENHGKSNTNQTTKGYTGTGKGFSLQALALMEDLRATIFYQADRKLFLGVLN